MEVAAYTYQADIYCGHCLVLQLLSAGEASPAALDMPTEDVLDQLQHNFGIDRYDEHSYDSGDFPKVVFGTSLEDDERCGACGERLR